MSWSRLVKQTISASLLATIPIALLHGQQSIPNSGQQITPTAPAGASFVPLNPGLADSPNYVAGQAVTGLVSPDGKTLLVLTSGYNLVDSSAGALIPADSTQFVFVYDISQHTPVKKQVIQVPNTYGGIVFDPSGTAFYVSGGVNDNVHGYSLQKGIWAEEAGGPISLGHGGVGVGLSVSPQAAGIAITNDGMKLVVANYYNDSISVLSKAADGWMVSNELDLRPGKLDPKQSGTPGGEYPLWVAIKGNSTAYVSSIRDREIVVVNIVSSPAVETRISVPGQPNRMVLNNAQSKLYVAQDNTDSIGVIDTSSNQLVENIAVSAPEGLLPGWKSKFKGNNTNSVTLSRDEKMLYVTNGWMNDVSVIQLNSEPKGSQVIGLIPTGWYPNSVSVSADGKFMYVVNGKSPTGANPDYCRGLTPAKAAQCRGSNEYNLQRIKAGLQSFPTPTSGELQALTQEVAINNHFKSKVSQEDAAKLQFLRGHIKHVIYIIKENRTYDQVLGDLEVGNGDPNLTEFPEATTPNQHALARNFVALDNFYDTSEVSYDGWSWSTSARSPDLVEKQVWINYSGRGVSYDSEGTNRNINVGYADQAGRLAANPLSPADPDDLPGGQNAAAPDAPDGENGTGYLWNGALRAGLSVRNYGFFIDLTRYSLPAAYGQYSIPLLINPSGTKTQVSYPANAALRPLTDIYYRGYDNAFPDFYRVKEWERELDSKFANGNLPNLSLVRLMHDHTGSFGSAILGVNTVELQVADNDYAVGLVAEKIAHSPQYKDNTLIFVIEDDSQDGGDHVDSHRSIAFVIGPYVKHNAVISTPYTTISMVRTIEEVLGIGSLNLNDSSANAMADVFDPKQKDWTYKAIPSGLLYNTQLPLPPQQAGQPIPRPTHDAAYWAAVTKGMDFSVEDRVDPQAFNHIVWEGLMGSKPYPAVASGLDLREDRRELLDRYRANVQSQATAAAGDRAPK